MDLSAFYYARAARSFQLNGSSREAIEFLDLSLKENPENVFSLQLRSTMYYILGEYDKSIENSIAALALDPTLPGAKSNLSSSHFAVGRNEIALKLILEAVEVRGDDFVILNNHANVLFAMRRFDECQEAISAILQKGKEMDPAEIRRIPQMNFVFVIRANMSTILQDFRASLEDINTARIHFPMLGTTLNHRARVLIALGRLDEALDDVTLCLSPECHHTRLYQDISLALTLRAEIVLRTILFRKFLAGRKKTILIRGVVDVEEEEKVDYGPRQACPFLVASTADFNLDEASAKHIDLASCQLEDALSDLVVAEKLDPRMGRLYLVRALVYFESGLVARALDSVSIAQEYRPYWDSEDEYEDVRRSIDGRQSWVLDAADAAMSDDTALFESIVFRSESFQLCSPASVVVLSTLVREEEEVFAS